MIINVRGDDYIHTETLFAGWGVCHGCGKPFPAEELHEEKAPGDVVPEKYCMECPLEWRGPLTKEWTKAHIAWARTRLEGR